MGKEILAVGDIETEKNKFYRHKTPDLFKRCKYLESFSI